MDPEHLQGAMRGLGCSEKGSWQILHKQREVVDDAGDSLSEEGEVIEKVEEEA